MLKSTGLRRTPDSPLAPLLNQNDVCSYREGLEGGRDSVILILKRIRLTDQQAIENVEDMVEHCYRRWHEALDDLPSL